MTWIRWRWQHGFSWQPYTKYHVVSTPENRTTLCNRAARHYAKPPWGNTTHDPPEHERCKQCAQIVKRDKAA